MKTHIKTTQMRKLTLLLLLLTGIVNAQIVNIPDANFKAKLLSASSSNTIASSQTPDSAGNVTNYNTIDVNVDGEIQVSEALAISFLNISSLYNTPIDEKISNLQGIEYFTNLINLGCSYNQLTNLNISNNINIKFLSCSFNQLTLLNLNFNVELAYLWCYNNQISNLLITNNILLKMINCNYNLLSSIDITNNTQLNFLTLDNNQIFELDLSNNTFLNLLSCNNNLLTSLDITGLTNLQHLNISNNQLTNFNFPTQLTLNSFYCSNNNLSQIDVSNIICDNYNFSNNPNLTYINMKNGHQDGCAVSLEIGLDYICSHFLGLPNLQFLCIDEGEADLWTIPGNIIMNGYCSFTPGGNYNTITGTTKFDSNTNGCDINDSIISNVKINITDGTNSGSTFTNIFGNYNFYSSEPTLNIVPILENPSYFTASPSDVTINFLNGSFGQTFNQDFCISANGEHHDVEMVIVPITPARPGFDAVYKLVYKNLGNQVENIVAPNFYFNDSVLDYAFSSIAPTSSGLGYLQWSLPSLLPFQNGEITITFHVNSPTDVPSVNIGDILAFSSIIDVVTDENWSDNNFTFNQTVVGSFDPNDITCLEGNNVAPSEIGEYLHYVINFENTGNYPAENVVVKTIVDATKFDVNSLQLLNTSNPVDARITGNVVEFIFENIQLGGPGGHGHILLKIKSKNTLVAGDEVAKNANIYFDYNAPVDTNLATTVFQSLSNTVFEKDHSINVSPNPTSGTININSNFNIKKVELYDVQGRVLETQIGETKTMDVSEKANGIYFLKITTEKGSKVEKVVKK